MTPSPTDHPAHAALERIVAASGVRPDDAETTTVPGGVDVRIAGVTQGFRCELVASEQGSVNAFGGAPRSAEGSWRWSVETRFVPNVLVAALLGSDIVDKLDERAFAGPVHVDEGEVRWRAHVTATNPDDPRPTTLLAHVARRQREFAMGSGIGAAIRYAAPATGPFSAVETAQRDVAVEAFGDRGVAATHVLAPGLVRVRLPWSTIEPGDAGAMEETYLRRAELGADVVIDVRAPVRTLGDTEALIETRLPVPEHVGDEDAEGWRTRMNAAELDLGPAGPVIGAWSLAVYEWPRRRRVWIHRCTVPTIAGALPWSLIADLALQRVRWALQELGAYYHRHEAEERPWSEPQPHVTLRQRMIRFRTGRSSSTEPSRLVPPDVPILTVASHLWACARARSMGPWVAHVARTEQRGAPHGAVGRERIVERLGRWMQAAGGVPDAGAWRWSITGTEDAPVGAPEPYHWRLPDADIRSLLAHAEANDIAVAWRRQLRRGVLGFAMQQQRRGGVRSERPPLGGSRTEAFPRVPLGRFVVTVDAATHSVPHAEVLVHELAHVLLGHTGSPFESTRPAVAPRGRQRLGLAVIEAEVSMVVILVLGRRGVRPDESIVRLVAFLDTARRLGLDAEIDLWHVFAAAERLLAWCVDRPDATTVASPGDAPLPLDGLARSAPTLEDWVRAVRRGRAVVRERVES